MSRFLVIRTDGNRITETFPASGRFNTYEEAHANANERASKFDAPVTFVVYEAVAEISPVRSTETHELRHVG